jgi:hypothetical protein
MGLSLALEAGLAAPLGGVEQVGWEFPAGLMWCLLVEELDEELVSASGRRKSSVT